MGANMAPASQNQPWVSGRDRIRRAGISSFDIGGTNAHVIVKEGPKIVQYSTQKNASARRLLPVVISYQNNTALRQQIKNLHTALSRLKMRLTYKKSPALGGSS